MKSIAFLLLPEGTQLIWNIAIMFKIMISAEGKHWRLVARLVG